MPSVAPLPAERCAKLSDPERLGFASTEELQSLEAIIGQDRAVDALHFGIEMDRRGYHIFAHGPTGTGKSTTIKRFLGRLAARRGRAADWCYVHNFDLPYRPCWLTLPPGRAVALSEGMDRLVEELLIAIPLAFESESTAARRQALMHSSESSSQDLFDQLRKEAAAMTIGLQQTREGINIVPLDGKEPMSREHYLALPEETRAQLREAMARIQDGLEGVTRAQRQLQRQASEALATLEREIAAGEAAYRFQELIEDYADLPEVVKYLERAQADLLDHRDLFRHDQADDSDDQAGSPSDLSAAARVRAQRRASVRLRRYAVNVLIDHSQSQGAPVDAERLPTVANLVGRIEHEPRAGGTMTDHTLIKPGALHRANGGYLILEAADLLSQPQAWEALKRALRHEEIRLEAPNAEPTPITSVTLDPQPIPLDCKVLLLGSTQLYLTMMDHDSDLAELFKVNAEFAASMPRSLKAERLLARFMSTVCRAEGIRHLRVDAVAALVDFSARLAGHQDRLSNHFMTITDLMREAEYWAEKGRRAQVEAVDVHRALSERETRSDLLRQRLLESVAYGLKTIPVHGLAIGQINGLTVLSRGDFSFGMPARISAIVGLGGGELVDIEREVDLSGSFHSKGVLILTGYLRNRYLHDEALSISASLTFEQSYSSVDGDSASAAELCALLSALADIPLRQDLAITGALDQHGRVQAIGGINEKIEGFYAVCKQEGLTGTQGVLLPKANVQQLMLDAELREAIAAGRFSLFAVDHVDEAMTLLTGLPAGKRAASGRFPPDSVNARVEARLGQLAERRRLLAPVDLFG